MPLKDLSISGGNNANNNQWWNGQNQLSAFPSVQPISPPTTNLGFNNPNLAVNMPTSTQSSASLLADKAPPDVAGSMMENWGGMALGVGKLGLGVFNALQQQKMNKFMRSYYGDQMARGRADFANNARSTNEALASKARVSASMRGHAFGSDENKAAVEAFMNQHRVDEKY